MGAQRARAEEQRLALLEGLALESPTLRTLPQGKTRASGGSMESKLGSRSVLATHVESRGERVPRWDLFWHYRGALQAIRERGPRNLRHCRRSPQGKRLVDGERLKKSA